MKIHRHYHGTDANFIATSANSINVIEQVHGRFIAYSSYFTEQTLMQLKGGLAEATSIESDNVFIDLQAKATNDLNIELDSCRKFYQSCRFDIAMIFKNDKFMLNQFGANDYNKARQSPKEMYTLLNDLFLITTRHETILAEGGWTPEQTAEIATRRDQLRTKMIEQDERKFQRKKATTTRVILLNQLYQVLSAYFKAGQNIFSDDDDVLEYLVFPAASAPTEEEENEENVAEENA